MTDYLLINYIQPDAGHAQAEIKTNGLKNFMLDFVSAADGLYYIGVCQKA